MFDGETQHHVIDVPMPYLPNIHKHHSRIEVAAGLGQGFKWGEETSESFVGTAVYVPDGSTWQSVHFCIPQWTQIAVYYDIGV
mgnify:CR=1 FL=1